MGKKLVSMLVVGCVGLAVSGQLSCDSPLAQRYLKEKERLFEWTPENIEKDPEGYLKFLIGQCDAKMREIEAHRIAQREEKSRLQSELDSAKSNLDQQRRDLESYKEKYRAAEASSQWPVAVGNGVKVNEAELTTMLVKKQEQVKETERRLAENPSEIQRLDNLMANCDVLTAEVNDHKMKAIKKPKELEQGAAYSPLPEIDFDAKIDSIGDTKPELQLDQIERREHPHTGKLNQILAE